jgi:serine/threonine-protein kinase
VSFDADLEPGTRVAGRYRLLELVGAGAMGSVWAALNETTEREFALKIMNPQAALDPTAVQRFLQEARAAGSLHHPGIVEVYDVGHHVVGGRGGQRLPFLVMELLQGETLESRLAREGQLAPSDVLSLLIEVARGLAAAHEAGIVHRDLKPANLFLHRQPRGSAVKILDFGISKLLGLGASDGVLTVAGVVLGSPPYMSPEQAGGKLDVDARTDVWALGVIAYRALSGRLPFAAPNYNALMLEIIGRDPEPIARMRPELDARFARIIEQCLRKEREQRPRDARALLQLLETLAASDTQSALAQVREPETAQRRPPRRTAALAAVAALTVGVVLVTVNSVRSVAGGGQVLVGPPARSSVEPLSQPAVVSPAQITSPTPATAPAVPGSAQPARAEDAQLEPAPVFNRGTPPKVRASKPARPRSSEPARSAPRVAPNQGTPPPGPPPVNEGVTSSGL